MAGTRAGTCRGCGQTQIVPADTEAEANMIATDRCTCKEGKGIRDFNRLMKNIDEICGTGGKQVGFDPVPATTIERIKEAAELVHHRKIEKSTFQINGTLITIKAGVKDVTVDRKRTLSIERTSEIGEREEDEED